MFLVAQLYSQVGIGTTDPSPAAMLDISSQTNGVGDYKGFLPPRVPDEDARNAINPTADDEGLLVFVRSTRCLNIWTGVAWEIIHCNESAAFASDLFLSEYVEGSGNNKALEIANFTGSPKNLINYEIYVASNGNPPGATPAVVFPNVVLQHGEVYVIVYYQANTTLLNLADLVVTSNMNFNGNDAVILRSSSGTYIDLMGTVGNNSYWGQDVTLRKKPTLGPSTAYDPIEFNVYSTDDFSGLGWHTYNP